jgi:hypothetical protein
MSSHSTGNFLIGVRAAQVVALVAILSTTAFGFSRGDYKPGGKEFPHPNPSPTKVFIIHGTIDPALQIEFDAIYGVTNRNACHLAAIGRVL